MKTLLGKNGNFYKANLHCHSTNSDGRMRVEDIKEAYKKQGYSVVAFTDHEHVIDNSHLTDGEFIAINACEIAIKEMPKNSTLINTNMRVVHLNFYAKDPENLITPCYSSVYDHYLNDEIRDKVKHDGEYERVYSSEGVSEIIAEAKRNGFIVSYNHPTWSLEDASRFCGYDGLFAIEIFNYGTYLMGLPDDEVAVDQMRRAGKKLWLTACDDNHNKDADSFGGFVMIDAKELRYASVISALEAGDFYASCGPEIYSVEREGDEIFVKCSPAARISVISETRAAKTVFAETGESLCSASFKINEKNGAFRVRVTDSCGKRAFTQYFEY